MKQPKTVRALRIQSYLRAELLKADRELRKQGTANVAMLMQRKEDLNRRDNIIKKYIFPFCLLNK